MLRHVCEFNFMLTTRLFFGSQRFKTENNDSPLLIYVPSAAIETILTSQCPCELFRKILPVKQRA